MDGFEPLDDRAVGSSCDSMDVDYADCIVGGRCTARMGLAG